MMMNCTGQQPLAQVTNNTVNVSSALPSMNDNPTLLANAQAAQMKVPQS
jgi:hypothetical protein